jgi:hypothetical protein
MKKLTIRKNIKRVNPSTKINSIRKRRTFILKKTTSSSDMSEDDNTKVLFMGIENQTETTEDNNYENE